MKTQEHYERTVMLENPERDPLKNPDLLRALQLMTYRSCTRDVVAFVVLTVPLGDQASYSFEVPVMMHPNGDLNVLDFDRFIQDWRSLLRQQVGTTIECRLKTHLIVPQAMIIPGRELTSPDETIKDLIHQAVMKVMDPYFAFQDTVAAVLYVSDLNADHATSTHIFRIQSTVGEDGKNPDPIPASEGQSFFDNLVKLMEGNWRQHLLMLIIQPLNSICPIDEFSLNQSIFEAISGLEIMSAYLHPFMGRRVRIRFVPNRDEDTPDDLREMTAELDLTDGYHEAQRASLLAQVHFDDEFEYRLTTEAIPHCD